MAAKKYRGGEGEKNFLWRFCGFNAKVEIDLTAEMPNN